MARAPALVMGTDLQPYVEGPSDESARLESLREPLPYYDVSDPPQAQIVEWRGSKLARAGVPDLPGRLLAGRRDIDLHDALRMLARGCPPHLLGEILL